MRVGPALYWKKKKTLKKDNIGWSLCQYRLVLVCLYNDRCSDILHYKRQNQSQNPWYFHGSCHPPVVKFIY